MNKVTTCPNPCGLHGTLDHHPPNSKLYVYVYLQYQASPTSQKFKECNKPLYLTFIDY